MKTRTLASLSLALGLLSSSADAGFHIMQIEQFIGSINGDTTAQAVQLRMRSSGQPFMSAARVRAWDALGANPIVLMDMTTDVANSNVGINVLIASPNFNAIMASVPGYNPDFTMTALVPVSYLNGGKITFESNGGSIYWALAFGAYTGTNTGLTDNDSDGNFGAPTVAPPSGAGVAQALKFTGAANALSTNNLADYGLSANPATVRNNASASFIVAPEPGSLALLAAMGVGAFAVARRRS